MPHTGFPTTCELCHDTIHWTDATFNHNNTPFPLTGSHTVPPRHVRGLPCQQQLHHAADDLYRLPPDRLQQHDESGARRAAAVFPDDVPELP